MVRLLLPALFMALAAALPAIAQRPQIITDKAPSALILEPGSTRLHVLTAGVDGNFNGVLDLDSGETAPRWFVIDTETNQVVDSTTFDALFNSFPIRAALDAVGRRMYMAQAGRIRAYDLSSLEIVDDTVAPGPYSGVSLDPLTRILFAHTRPGFSSVGEVHALLPRTGDTIGIYRVGINPVMSVASGDIWNRGAAVYTLSEGSFGRPNALLSYITGNPDVYTAFNGEPIGTGSVSIARYRTSDAIMILAAMHDDDAVRVIDTRMHRPVRTIAVDAPSAVALDSTSNGSIVVGTDNGMLYRFVESTGEARDSFALPGKVATMAWHATVGAIVAGDSTVVIFDAAASQLIDTIDVGGVPSYMFFDAGGNLHAVGSSTPGSDWWRVYDGETFALTETRSITGLAHLDVGTPLVYDRLSDTLFAVVGSDGGPARAIVGFAASDSTASADTIFAEPKLSGELVSIDVSPEYLAVVERVRVPEDTVGYVHLIERSDRQHAMRAIAGTRPTDVKFVSPGVNGAHAVYVVNQATVAPMLAHFGYLRDVLGDDTLGSGGNHLLALANDRGLAVTLNGSHEIVHVDKESGTVLSRLSTGTTGFDGPREAIEIVGGLEPGFAVTTYAGDVRFLEGGPPHRIEPTGGKSEGIVRVEDRLYVANAFTPSYAADSTVVIIELSATGVEDDAVVAVVLDQSMPNPASSRARVRFSVGARSHVRLEIRSVSGDLVGVVLDELVDAGSHSVELPIDELPAGTYLYTLRDGSVVASRIMQVVR